MPRRRRFNMLRGVQQKMRISDLLNLVQRFPPSSTNANGYLPSARRARSRVCGALMTLPVEFLPYQKDVCTCRNCAALTSGITPVHALADMRSYRAAISLAWQRPSPTFTTRTSRMAAELYLSCLYQFFSSLRQSAFRLAPFTSVLRPPSAGRQEIGDAPPAWSLRVAGRRMDARRGFRLLPAFRSTPRAFSWVVRHPCHFSPLASWRAG
ncbi:hypothetical protein BCV69DRAFT_107381 [Microstroma glucosiphilum]|uniref:Uncharacterized protein n=1 Tax=Pseudomicrostroma glucosiphilum TaxID=1684307 RepID=A0A316UIQ2_9BASI|nr:hypothetical protein BCV69DRAFT_107381 [Pseudomicrostroma glucosiphilum]PWN23085.1 hypothetical protein BCV69DRAFT_107381 [Pseudomicrostroma glucosiphilum]